MGGKARRRREKNYVAAHGGNNRLPPPPEPSSLTALPSKLRRIISFSSSSSSSSFQSNLGSEKASVNDRKEVNKEVDGENKPRQEDSKSRGNMKREENVCSTTPHGVENGDDNVNGNTVDEKKKKRKRKQVNDLRFEAEMKQLGVISKRRQRKKEYLKAKKKKHKKGHTEENQDFPKRDEVKFGEIVEAPPKLAVIPKAPRKPLVASQERLRVQAIEAYRNRRGWTNRPGLLLPPVNSSPSLP